MLYASGENPEVGDRVTNRGGRVGTVTVIATSLSGISDLIVKWDDGIVGITYSNAEDFTLIWRAFDLG
jgi:hypothetical protein